MLDIPAQSSGEASSPAPSETDNSRPDRFAILNEAEKRVHDLLDSSAADKLMKQAEAVESTSVPVAVAEEQPAPVEPVMETDGTAASPETAVEEEKKIAQAQDLLKRATDLQDAPPIAAPPKETTSTPEITLANEPANVLKESFSDREAKKPELPTAEIAPFAEIPSQGLDKKEEESLVREVTQFEQQVSTDSDVLNVADIEHASKILSPLSHTLTREQDRREVGIRAAIAAHRESLRAA
jgi:hypothetical protein